VTRQYSTDEARYGNLQQKSKNPNNYSAFPFLHYFSHILNPIHKIHALLVTNLNIGSTSGHEFFINIRTLTSHISHLWMELTRTIANLHQQNVVKNN